MKMLPDALVALARYKCSNFYKMELILKEWSGRLGGQWEETTTHNDKKRGWNKGWIESNLTQYKAHKRFIYWYQIR